MTDDEKLRDYLKRVTVDLHDARLRLREVESSAGEPVAIIGMSCRYPGGIASAEDLWEAVSAGRDAISPFPSDRGWDLQALYDPDPDRPGTTYVREGGFLDEVANFDADFFSISPREALAMDPQQRTLLESCWEAIESAGVDPLSLRGSSTGVFVGGATNGYGVGSVGGSGSAPDSLDGHYGAGTLSSIMSGRIAYVLGLEGPALTIDTACSSSLVALHLACGSLRGRESSLALLAGVNIMPTPTVFVELARQRGLAPDGRCKSYADGADGTSWSEGVGVLVLERLSDAQRRGRRVLATVCASAVNQDGASNGLTAPNGPSQQRVIRRALANARLSAKDVDVVEGHGTGTTLGDPIEAQALLATYGQDRPDASPLWLGSIKSNIGHTQAAAGVAGVIKMVMALQYEKLPRTLHVDRPSEQVNWSEGEVSLLLEEQPWQRGERPRRAGVSSFGASGTNAHVILEEAPAAERVAHQTPGQQKSASPTRVGLIGGDTVPFLLSARSEVALQTQAARLRAHVGAHPEISSADIGLSLTRRSAFGYRAVAIAGERQEFSNGLEAIAGAQANAAVLSGHVRPAGPGEIVFVFPGQGSQWLGMALELQDRSSVFAERLCECEEALGPFVDWSLQDVLRGGEQASELERIDVVQPALFAVMVALARLWNACGVQPGAVVGHSQGEIAAAHVAGALSLDEAASIVARRSQMLSALTEQGSVATVALGVEQVSERLKRWSDRIVVAGINGPRSVVVAGEREALVEFLEDCSASDVRAREVLGASVATHCSNVEVLRSDVIEAFSGLAPRAGDVEFYSTVLGGPIGGDRLDAEYWYRNLREPVEFERATRALLDAGYRTFIEVSPHPVLSVGMHETLEDALAHRASEQTAESASKRSTPEISSSLSIADVGVHGSLRRDEGGPRRFLASLSEVWVRGVEVDWDALFEGIDADTVQLPTYAFQGRRYWLQAAPGGVGDLASVGQLSTRHPLIGAAVALAQSDGWLFTGRISLQQHPWFADHRVGDSVVVPGTTFVEIALRAGDLLECDELEDLVFERPMILDEREASQLQVTVGAPDERGRREIGVFSRLEDCSGETDTGNEREWTRHAHGLLAISPSEPLEREVGVLTEEWPPLGAQPIGVEELYDYFAGVGLDYGPAFLSIRAAWRRGAEAFTEVRLPEDLHAEAAQCGIHPALLDCALQAGGVLMREENPATPEYAVFPFAWSRVRLHAGGTGSLRVRLAQLPEGGMSMLASDEQGQAVLSAGSVVVRKVSSEFLSSLRSGQSRSLYQLEWSQIGTTAGEANAEAEHTELPAETVVAYVGSEDEEAFPAGARRILAQGLSLIQEWLGREHSAEERLVLVTKGAVAIDARSGVGDPAAASLWGLVRSAQSEHPGSFVLVDTDGGELSAQALHRVLASEEPQLALRDEELLVARLRRVEVEAGEGARDLAGIGTCASGAPGTVLVTGGTGTLGSLLATHLVENHGVRRLLLASRSGPQAQRAARLQSELEGLGAHVRIEQCDMSDTKQLERLIDAVEPEYPLSAVIHTAGALDDGVIASMTPDRVDGVFAPKADAAWHLHELTKDLDLSAFVLFSSSTGTFGGPAQSNYAAANAALDSLAAYRRGLGLPAVSMAWGLWAGSEGMASELSEADHRRMERMGMLAISPDEGMELFDAAYAIDRPAILPARLDTAGLRSRARAGMVAPVLQGLIRVPARASENTTGSLARRLESTPEGEREQVVLDLVRSEVASVLGYESPDAIDVQRAFNELGFDSLTAVELRNRLSGASGVQLPATLAFDYPSTAALSEYLLRRILPEIGEHEPEQGPSEEEVRSAIASIPLARLREAGMVDALMRLAGLTDESSVPLEQEALESIDEMDVESLVKMTLAEEDVIDELEVGS